MTLVCRRADKQMGRWIWSRLWATANAHPWQWGSHFHRAFHNVVSISKGKTIKLEYFNTKGNQRKKSRVTIALIILKVRQNLAPAATSIQNFLQPHVIFSLHFSPFLPLYPFHPHILIPLNPISHKVSHVFGIFTASLASIQYSQFIWSSVMRI